MVKLTLVILIAGLRYQELLLQLLGGLHGEKLLVNQI
nr:MAG TPA: hypothetical protein [Caudoviricetes sp.]